MLVTTIRFYCPYYWTVIQQWYLWNPLGCPLYPTCWMWYQIRHLVLLYQLLWGQPSHHCAAQAGLLDGFLVIIPCLVGRANSSLCCHCHTWFRASIITFEYLSSSCLKCLAHHIFFPLFPKHVPFALESFYFKCGHIMSSRYQGLFCCFCIYHIPAVLQMPKSNNCLACFIVLFVLSFIWFWTSHFWAWVSVIL